MTVDSQLVLYAGAPTLPNSNQSGDIRAVCHKERNSRLCWGRNMLMNGYKNVLGKNMEDSGLSMLGRQGFLR